MADDPTTLTEGEEPEAPAPASSTPYVAPTAQPLASAFTPQAQDYIATMAKHGYSPEAISGGLGFGQQESGMRPDAFNPAGGGHGALGLGQWRGSRQENYVGFIGGQPPTVENAADFEDHELRGTHAQVGETIRNATDTDTATDGWAQYEASGDPAETVRAKEIARRAYPLVKAQLAQNQAKENAATASAASDWEQQTGPAVGGRFDKTSAGPVQPPRANSTADASNLWQQQLDADKTSAPPTTPGQPAGEGSFWHSAWNALKELPRGAAMGALRTFGALPDLFNLGSYLDAHYPAASLATLGAMAGPGGALIATEAADKANVPAYDPNGQGIHLPLGSEDLAGAVKHVTGVDLHQQGTDLASGLAYNAGTFAGMGFNPASVAADVRGGASALGLITKHVLAPGAIGGGADLGAYAAGDTPAEHDIANMLTVPAGIAGRAALEAGLIKSFKIGGAAVNAATADTNWNTLDQAFKASYGEGADAKKAEALASLDGFERGGALPQGYETPAALQTSSDPIRQLYASYLHNDPQLRNDFITRVNPQNTAALNGMYPEGAAEDAQQAAKNIQTMAQNVIDARVAQAEHAAAQAHSVAAINSRGQPLPEGGPDGQQAAFDAAKASLDELRGARADTKTMADGLWQVARQQGLTDTQVAPADNASLYSRLLGDMQNHLQAGKDPRDYPFDALAPLFVDGNPRGMFDNTRNVRPGLLPSAEDAGPNAFFGGAGRPAPTLDQLKNVDNSLGERIRQEQDALSNGGNRGNRLLLSNLQDARDTVWNTIQKTAMDNGNQVALNAAMAGTALYHKTFSNGVLGDLLSSSPEDFGISGNPQSILRRYLGNTGNAISSAQAIQQAMMQRTGAAAAAKGILNGTPGATPAQQFANTWADYLRQDFLNTRADLGPTQAKSWLTNRAGFFGKLSDDPQMGQTFSQLHDELRGYQQMADRDLPQVVGQAKKDTATLQGNAINEFMGGEAGPRLDAILSSDRPMTEMRGLVQGSLRQGDGGAAFRGLQNMMFDKLMTEASVHDPITGTQYFSGAAATKFLAENKLAYAAIGEADPGWVGRLATTMRALRLNDEGRFGTGLMLPPEATPQRGSAGQDLGTAAFRVMAVKGAEHLGIGHNTGLQGPAIVSGLAGKWAPGLQRAMAKTLGRVDLFTASKNAMRDALQDPTGQKLRTLLTPLNTPAGQHGIMAAEPWFQSTGLGLLHSYMTGLGAEPQPGGQDNSQP